LETAPHESFAPHLAASVKRCLQTRLARARPGTRLWNRRESVAAEIPDGAVLVARAILNSSLWMMRSDDCKVAITCIALANWKERKWFDGKKEIVIMRGQFVRSREELATSCALSVQRMRTSIAHLERSGFLTRKSTKTYTLYTVPKYDFYQRLGNYSDSANPETNPQLTHKQPTPNPRLTTNKKGKKGEEGKEDGPPPSDGIHKKREINPLLDWR
jgi:hypothetical protein